jgi:type VI secretion system protein ImpL
VLPILISALILILSLLLAWAVSFLPGITGTSLLVLRILLLVLGVGVAAVILILEIRRRRRDAATRSLPGGQELDALLRDAEKRIATAQHTGPKSLAALPLLYILGDANSTKTTTVLKSGFDPELIAGQIYRDQDVVPTPVANFWYTQAAVIVEAGEAVRKNAALWSKLIRRTRPRVIRSAMGKHTPVRAAVVCISCEQFLGAGASDAVLAAARSTNQMLRELSHQLGTEIPVYVILAKLDRIPDFTEFVRNLTGEEASVPLGMALDRTEVSGGLYAEKATSQVTSVLDQLVFALSEYRVELLTRETEQRNIDPVYEFPRELRKLRNNLANYLVELARPSHLNFNPYLRGIYLTGVRAQILEQMVASPAQTPQAQVADAGATRMFSLEQARAASAAPAPQMVAQKVAQWCFLPRLLPSVILGDRSALAATSNSGRTHVFRRVTFALISLVLLALLACLTISWVHNTALEQSILSAADAIPTSAVAPPALASEQALVELDRLRASLVQLEGFRRNGVPFLYTFGLYHGDALFDPARQIYFSAFHRLLLASTQANLAQFLSRLPAASKPGDNYQAAYDPLKAYLITTNNPEKSNPEFLSPVLMQFWENGRAPDSQKQSSLARLQFDFYAAELAVSDPYPLAPNMPDPPVTQARAYLNTFGGQERIYQQMLTAAGNGSHAVDFNRDYPGSSATVVDSHVVPAAFTSKGYPLMQDALAHPDRFFSGDKWVLGDQASTSLNAATLTQQLTARYEQDYLAQWNAFLRAAQVIRYRSLSDASTKLTLLSGPNSALLALLYTASHGTAVADQQIAKPFQPAQAVVAPESTDKLIGPGNQNYVTGLAGLQGAIAQVALTPIDPTNQTALLPVLNAVTSAHGAALQTSQSFDNTPETQPVLNLLQAPINSVDDLVRAQGPKQANGGGASFCAAFSPLMSKFPFNSNGPDATLPELASVLQPTSGALAQLSDTVRPLVIQQGNNFAANPTSPIKVTSDFLRFFTRVKNLSALLFPPNAEAPGLNFTVQILPASGVQNVSFQVDKQSLSGAGSTKMFVWTMQNSQQAQLTVGSDTLQFSGNWALLHLIAKGQREQPSSPIRLSYPFGFLNTSSYHVVRLEFSPNASVLMPGELAPTRCVATVAH